MATILDEERAPALSLKAILPGLIYIAIVDLLSITGVVQLSSGFLQSWGLVVGIIPWVTVLVMRKSPSVFGYRRYRMLSEYGRGMIAGGIWRGLSMGFNLWWQGGWTFINWGVWYWLGSIFFIPLVEETFFRGYLCRALLPILGKWPAIITQALLFSLHPGHWIQGGLHLVSIFCFGVLSGWLIVKRGSIWTTWGAHGFANVLPQILVHFA